MRLDAILQKTQKRGEAAEKQIQKINIATADRPYDLLGEQQKSEKNREQTGNKLETHSVDTNANNNVSMNGEESVELKPETKREQSGNETVIEKTENKSENSMQNAQQPLEKKRTSPLKPLHKTGNKPETDLVDVNANSNTRVHRERIVKLKPETNRKQTGSEQIISQTDVGSVPSILLLVGLQRDILLFLYQECKRARCEITGALTLDRVGDHIGANQDVVKTTLRRLQKKGYIERVEFKNGRGGWTRYKVLTGVYREILIMESDVFFSNSVIVSSEKKEMVEDVVVAEDKSVPLFDRLPQEWQEIDLSALSIIKFTPSHLFQIYKMGCFDAKAIQESINAFAFDLQENKKSENFKSGPLNFFMGILRKGAPYLPPENYESPEEKALRHYIRYRKTKEAQQKALEQEALELAFAEWEKSLSDEEVLSLCERADYAKDKTSIRRKGHLTLYFQKQIWPEKKDSFFKTGNKQETA